MQLANVIYISERATINVFSMVGLLKMNINLRMCTLNQKEAAGYGKQHVI
jgi:hypothetical protein